MSSDGPRQRKNRRRAGDLDEGRDAKPPSMDGGGQAAPHGEAKGHADHRAKPWRISHSAREHSQLAAACEASLCFAW